MMMQQGRVVILTYKLLYTFFNVFYFICCDGEKTFVQKNNPTKNTCTKNNMVQIAMIPQQISNKQQHIKTQNKQNSGSEQVAGTKL